MALTSAMEDYHLSERPHDCDHAFALGNIDANAVHPHSSNTTNLCNRNPSFLAADSIYWVTRTPRHPVGSTCSNRTLQQEDG